jgi:hypothetical protein
MFVVVFKCFSGVFASVSDACFKCLIYLLLYVVTVASGYFKSRSGVAHGIRVGSGRRRGRRSGQRGRRPGGAGHIEGALSHEPDALCARLLPLRGSVRTLTPRTDVRTLVSLFFSVPTNGSLHALHGFRSPSVHVRLYSPDFFIFNPFYNRKIHIYTSRWLYSECRSQYRRYDLWHRDCTSRRHRFRR